MSFEYELAELLNKHSQENHSDTPSMILAIYLKNCLSAWNEALAEREHWYGRPVSKERAIPGIPPSLRGSWPSGEIR